MVVGSVGIDTVETPSAVRKNVLGGSAVYFSFASAWYVKTRFLGVVGEDFPVEYRLLLADRNIDLQGLSQEQGGKTFRWHGRYHEDFVGRETLAVDLNVLGSFKPVVPQAWRNSAFVLLANGSPQVQLSTLAQMKKRPRFVVADTMDLWIRTTPKELAKLLRKSDALSLNDDEARLLTGRRELICAGKEIQKMGPKWVIIKKGEHGCLLVGPNGCFALPALPLENVVDPTGAGDSFAGGMLGYLARECAVKEVTENAIRLALFHGTVAASFTVEGFSIDGLLAATPEKRRARMATLRELVRLPQERKRTKIF
jgi:sugar/nucleoside kinase (ribokinase family)